MSFRKTMIVACVFGLGGLILTGCLSKSPEQQQIFTIEEFGAVGDGVHDDVSALKKAFRAMKTVDGKVTLVFSKKTYRLGKQIESDAQFDFSGMKNVVVDGQGATLIMDPVHGLARCFDSRNITFRNFIIQHDPLPFMQGEVLAVSPDEGFFLWRVQAGFPLPPSEQWMQQDGNFFDDPAKGLPDRSGWDQRSEGSSWCWGTVLEAGEKTLKKNFADHLFVKTVVPAGTGDERVYRVFVIDSYKVHLSKMVAGERFVLPRFYRTAEEYFTLKDKGWMSEQNVQIRKSADIFVENLTFYSARPGMVFGVRHNEGSITIRGCTVTWLPGTDRLIASWRDGVHCKNNRIGPTIEDCHFEGLFDDSINMSADAFMAETVLAPDRVVLTGAAFGVGDEVGVLHSATGAWETGVLVVEADGRTVVFNRPVEQVVEGTMTPKKDIAATQFYNLSHANDGFVVRNNFFGIQRRHAVLARCSNGVIESNVIQGVCGGAVELSNATGSFYEGPFPRDLIIRNNRISGTPRTPIIIRTMSAPGAPPPAPVTGNILFEGNEVIFVSEPHIHLQAVENITFKNNRFLSPDGSSVSAEKALAIDRACRNIEVDGVPYFAPSPGRVAAAALQEELLRNRPAPLTNMNVRAALNVKDFGAVPNDGQDDRAAVVAAIEKAGSMEGPVQIDFDPGRYDFMPVTPGFSSGQVNAAMPLVKRANLIVDGHGAEVVIHRQDVGFAWAEASTNLIIRNFSVDYDPLPFSQGSVVAVDPVDSSFVFELHPGFPTPDDPFFKSCNSWGMLKDTQHPGRLKSDCPSFFMYSDILPLGDNRFRIVLSNKKEISNFETGDVFVVNGRSASVGQYFNSENITFDGLTIYASPSCLFLGSGTSLLNILNCKGLLKGNRLITAGADGVHCQSAPIGPWIENCEFEGLSDDCLNIYGLPIFILSQSSPTEMRGSAKVPIKPGDALVFFNPNSGGIIQETTVVSFAGNVLVLKDPVGTLNIASPGTPVKEHDWKIYDHAYNLNVIGNGFVYRNNYMHDGRRYGIFIKASNGLIENNRFEGLSCNAFQIANAPGWPEGFWARNLVIQNNRISECGYGAKYPPAVIAGEKLRGVTETPIQKNIFLLNNTFNAISGPALTLSGVADLVAEGNVFASGSESGPLITIQYSKHVRLKNNEGQDRIEIKHMNVTGVELDEK